MKEILTCTEENLAMNTAKLTRMERKKLCFRLCDDVSEPLDSFLFSGVGLIDRSNLMEKGSARL